MALGLYSLDSSSRRWSQACPGGSLQPLKSSFSFQMFVNASIAQESQERLSEFSKSTRKEWNQDIIVIIFFIRYWFNCKRKCQCTHTHTIRIYILSVSWNLFEGWEIERGRISTQQISVVFFLCADRNLKKKNNTLKKLLEQHTLT